MLIKFKKVENVMQKDVTRAGELMCEGFKDVYRSRSYKKLVGEAASRYFSTADMSLTYGAYDEQNLVARPFLHYPGSLFMHTYALQMREKWQMRETSPLKRFTNAGFDLAAAYYVSCSKFRGFCEKNVLLSFG